MFGVDLCYLVTGVESGEMEQLKRDYAYDHDISKRLLGLTIKYHRINCRLQPGQLVRILKSRGITGAGYELLSDWEKGISVPDQKTFGNFKFFN